MSALSISNEDVPDVFLQLIQMKIFQEEYKILPRHCLLPANRFWSITQSRTEIFPSQIGQIRASRFGSTKNLLGLRK